MLHQVEDAEDPDDPQYEDRLQHCPVVLQAVVGVGQIQNDLDVERQQGQDVDDVHHVPEELELVRSEQHPYQQLDGKERRTDVIQISQEWFRHHRRYGFVPLSRSALPRHIFHRKHDR